MIQNLGNKRHPFFDLLYLTLLVLLGTVVFSIIGMLLGTLIYGIDGLLNTLSGKGSLGFLKTLQIISSLGTFLIPAWLYARSENKPAPSFFKLNTAFYPFLIILTISIIFSSSGVLTWAVELNKQMQLPDFLKGLENWMRLQEDRMAILTQQLLLMNSPGDLTINLLMIALLPALGEELIFRGCLQRIFTRWTQSHHWGIWIAAIVFSAIHIQFYGFIPRMLLGALFGYLLLWSNNLWFPILGHFINNATAVLTAYVYQQQGKPLADLDQNEWVPTPVFLTSLFFTAATLWVFYQYTRQKGITKTIESNG